MELFLKNETGVVNQVMTDIYGDRKKFKGYMNADKEDIEGLTRAINGGTLGLDDRKKRWGVCLSVLVQTFA